MMKKCTIFERLYPCCNRADHFPVWKCSTALCDPALSTEPDRLFCALWYGDGLRISAINSYVTDWRNCGRSCKQKDDYGCS